MIGRQCGKTVMMMTKIILDDPYIQEYDKKIESLVAERNFYIKSTYRDVFDYVGHVGSSEENIK